MLKKLLISSVLVGSILGGSSVLDIPQITNKAEAAEAIHYYSETIGAGKTKAFRNDTFSVPHSSGTSIHGWQVASKGEADIVYEVWEITKDGDKRVNAQSYYGNIASQQTSSWFLLPLKNIPTNKKLYLVINNRGPGDVTLAGNIWNND
ncbi:MULTISPECIES: hypothetical protein [Bacteria]|uniref:DUF642 domain-containing protein n=4 Tax=Bacillus TaxID=1386 RepID=A0A0J1HX90_BACAN|nr:MULTISPECIES: hypothetical protein [Bacteria]EOQ19627.1 hypothetical protein IKC_04101 [Bacillus cereus VD184]KLV18299.1 hypothetical protein ABW01_13025 [Bacillus anthracis]MBF8118828.1 hypothetical protein [Bacillus cereus]MCC2357415.1 hypothetical protein [Bacillus paranthracis]MCC3687023.1 hypothetical protein [Bacillus cereus]